MDKKKNNFEQNINISAIIMVHAIKIYFEIKLNHPSKNESITIIDK